MTHIYKLDLLISLYIFCICVSELMGGKTFPLFHIGSFYVSSSVAVLVLPMVFTINDIITEVYGKKRAQSIVKSGLMVIVCLLVFSLIATSLPPSNRFVPSEKAYDAVFTTSIRIALSSLISFTIAEFLDVAIFVFIRQRLGKKDLWLRNNISNFISQFFDTTLFMFLAFYSLDKSLQSNTTFLIGLILPYWVLKCCMSIIETPFVYMGVKWLRKGESL